ncbi:MAG: hypothetical protein DUD33_00605 [Coriobacteriaceae bacterium]|jgi:hypothetical protein|nr:hypothetical protein [Olsenella sp.]MCI1289563.1 hypothetical protein [Olsenella sp.]RRF91322.1 MAG: hypothetical protein DUD33_00605 [Coriobacteriaceae bacterium]
MPAIMTHDFFGKDAYAGVAESRGFVTIQERQAFLLGNQGPDPLFYLVADPFVGASNRVGGLMHHARTARLVVSLRDALTMLNRAERPVGNAYAAGFVCHYLLDRAVHPLVYHYQYGICDAGVPGLSRADGDEVHAEIERDLDEMVLFSKTGMTVRSFRPYREILRADDETLAVIDKLYFYMNLWTYSKTLELDCYSRAVKSFRLVQRLFYTPNQGKTRVLAPIERRLGHSRYSLYAAMAHRDRAEQTSDFDNREGRPWRNPFDGTVSTDGFWQLYQGAQDEVAGALDAFFSLEFDEAAAEALTRNLNFSGQHADPDDPEGPSEPGVGA